MRFSTEGLTYRLATMHDAKLYFDWVNEPSVRRNAHQSDPIEWEEHQKWFVDHLNSRSLMLIFFYRDVPVGQIRADVEGSKALLDLSVDKEYRGKNIGTLMLITITSLIQKVRTVLTMEGVVKSENIASAKAFKQSGFTLQTSMNINGVKCYKFEYYFK
jgi:UDP-2,4-diacetamido-2,4,6-trideoxy-beta-L-altropyranose hydrolase